MDWMDIVKALGAALVVLGPPLLKLWFEYRELRKEGKRMHLLELIDKLSGPVMLAAERAAAETDTPADDIAVARMKEMLHRAGEAVPDEMEDYIRKLLSGRYREYLVSQGIPANVDGKAGKQALADAALADLKPEAGAEGNGDGSSGTLPGPA